jgi:DNA-binding response OmpR family regulator
MRPNGGRRNVLIVGVDTSTYQRVAPILGRTDFDVDRFPNGETALELLEVVPFDVILVCHPLPDMETEKFLNRIRGREGTSACLRSAVVLLSNTASLVEARRLEGRGANRVLQLDGDEGVLETAVAGLLRVATRISVRIMAHISVEVASGKTTVLCQTENVSESGMLLRTDRQFSIGSILGFEFQLIGLSESITGRAEVVRHTHLGRDSVMGVGVRFVEIFGDGRRRLEGHLSKTVAAGAA